MNKENRMNKVWVGVMVLLLFSAVSLAGGAAKAQVTAQEVCQVETANFLNGVEANEFLPIIKLIVNKASIDSWMEDGKLVIDPAFMGEWEFGELIRIIPQEGVNQAFAGSIIQGDEITTFVANFKTEGKWTVWLEWDAEIQSGRYVFQVVTYDYTPDAGGSSISVVGPGDGTMVGGTVLPAPPTMSTVICKCEKTSAGSCADDQDCQDGKHCQGTSKYFCEWGTKSIVQIYVSP